MNTTITAAGNGRGTAAHGLCARRRTLSSISGHEIVRLETGDALSLIDAAGVEITCSGGRLWITMEGDTRDVTVGAGEAYTIERDGQTIVSACEPSIVATRQLWDASYAGWRPWLRRFASWLVRMAEARVRTHARLSRYY